MWILLQFRRSLLLDPLIVFHETENFCRSTPRVASSSRTFAFIAINASWPCGLHRFIGPRDIASVGGPFAIICHAVFSLVPTSYTAFGCPTCQNNLWIPASRLVPCLRPRPRAKTLDGEYSSQHSTQRAELPLWRRNNLPATTVGVDKMTHDSGAVAGLGRL